MLLDQMIEEVTRWTSDVELLGATARRLIAIGDEFLDLPSEQGVLALKEERERRLQWRLSVVNEASMRIGTTLDMARTAQELADLTTGHPADQVTVDLLDEILEVPDIPHTRTGKKLEVPVKRLLQGVPVDQVLAPAAVDAPDLINHFARLGIERQAARNQT
ncbi:hypothetical protein [Streptomyces sp. S3(2020)]|uniref:hypothetical protein n=1 Tax=Streptomyces sp. S3(2020) TaxID=2732044 RepID=UPI001F0EDF57|nr:hypothetical protein [Streptomyces sp. S3(2020)]